MSRTASVRILIVVFCVCAVESTRAVNEEIDNCQALFSRLGSVVQSTPFEQVKGANVVSVFEDEPELFRRTFIDPTKISRLQADLKKLPAAEQVKRGFETYLEHRLKNYPSWVKKKIYAAVKEAKVTDGEALRRAPNAGKSGISLIVPNELRDSVSHYKLLAHEVEIAIQDAEVAMGLTKKPDRYLSEFGAIRAEWDFKRIFPSEILKREVDRVKTSRLSSAQKENEMREFLRPAETFQQFRSNHFTSNSRQSVGSLERGELEHLFTKAKDASKEVPASTSVTSAPDVAKTATGYSNRHSAAIDSLIARRLLSKEDGDHILKSGDAKKISEVVASDKISAEERKKLSELFGAETKEETGQTVASGSQARPASENREAVRKFVQMIEARYGIEDLLDEPHLLRNGKVLHFGEIGKKGWQLTFTDRSLDELGKAERPIIQKFINAIRVGLASETLDPTKVRILSSVSSGSKGRPFEIPIVQRGHPRLLGCMKNNVFTVLTYDSHAPETMAAFQQKYAKLCD